MNKLVTILLPTLVGLFGLLAYSQFAALRQQREQIRQLNGKLESVSLDLQQKCAAQAEKFFKSSPWLQKYGTEFSSHYNQKLNRCFVLVQDRDFKTMPSKMLYGESLYDAFEGKLYGEYAWEPLKGKSDANVSPLLCDVTSPSGEKTICHTSDEFNELVKQYME